MDAEFITFLTDPFNIGLRVARSTEGRRSNIHPDQIEQTVEGQVIGCVRREIPFSNALAILRSVAVRFSQSELWIRTAEARRLPLRRKASVRLVLV